jgi:hypothetical protein
MDWQQQPGYPGAAASAPYAGGYLPTVRVFPTLLRATREPHGGAARLVTGPRVFPCS